MPDGTGLSKFEKEIPNRYYDTGICESHLTAMAAGMAKAGMRPFAAIYSTFLQRAFDQVWQEVALNNLPVVFCMDRAGLSHNDGPTHHGLFDIAYLRTIPRTVIMQPKDEDEMVDMLHTAFLHNGPAFIRYPRGPAAGVKIKDQPVALPIGQAEVLREGRDLIIWALGPMLQDAAQLADKLAAEHGLSVGIVNARFAKPLDTELLHQHARAAKLIVTMEDHAVIGGFGSAVLEALSEGNLSTPVERIGWPDRFVGHATTPADLRAAHGLSPADIEAKILRRWQAVTAKSRVPMEAK
jgi:1-deoxy-D-xylulose-5-phosphate synthase